MEPNFVESMGSRCFSFSMFERHFVTFRNHAAHAFSSQEWNSHSLFDFTDEVLLLWPSGRRKGVSYSWGKVDSILAYKTSNNLSSNLL
jgi:hypothetical protein